MEVQRAELKIVLIAFQRSPKLAKLLRYLAESALDGRAEDLTEHNIAIHVFERKETSFIASDDALVRVETHRLRKKLNTYYKDDGRDHALHISIPLGTYIPQFLHASQTDESAPSTADISGQKTKSIEQEFGDTPDSAESEIEESLDPIAASELPAAVKLANAPRTLSDHVKAKADSSEPANIGVTRPPARHKYQLTLAGSLAALALVSCFVIAFVMQHYSANSRNTQTAPAEHVAASGRVSAAIPLRMIAGYSGPAQRDSSGDMWQSDQYYGNGSPIQRHNTFIDGTLDPILYRFGRTGALNYDIPLPAGTYELHLHFAEITPVLQAEDTVANCMFNVQVNGKLEIADIDPVSDGGGLNVADVRILRDVSPAPDGILHLHLGIEMGIPHLSALELIPSKRGSQQPIRITARTNAWTDRNGNVWHSDAYFRGGRKQVHSLPGSLGADADLYSAERYGHFAYLVPVDSRDRYTVILHFAELYFGNEDSETNGVGKRIFKVICNGNTLLDNFDIAQEVGSGKPLVKTFTHIKPTAQGKLELNFEPIKNYASVSAIEVIDESGK